MNLGICSTGDEEAPLEKTTGVHEAWQTGRCDQVRGVRGGWRRSSIKPGVRLRHPEGRLEAAKSVELRTDMLGMVRSCRAVTEKQGVKSRKSDQEHRAKWDRINKK